MNVTSLVFLALALLAALVFQGLPKRFRSVWLLAVSVAFLATWSWQFIIVLAAFGLLNYGLAIKIEASFTRKKAWLTAGILFNLATLFVFKYSHFYLPALERLLTRAGTQGAGEGLKILLPVGLSFLVVQAISYLVDVANKRMPAERNLLAYLIYTVYFPKLLSGPVERARQFLPRLAAPLRLDLKLLERGTYLVLSGIFRKIFFADALFRMIPESAFVTPLEYSGQNLVFWLLGYAFALYNDFAGYTAIVRGVSLWFGIELTNNFNLPYFSRNFSEFWTRWHISLSNWLRDYIFFPLSRGLMSRKTSWMNAAAVVVPPLATLLVSGLWHGLGWNLLCWGVLHGLFLLAERLAGLIKRPVPPQDQKFWQRAFGLGLTFTLTVLAWLPFRLSLPVAWQYLRGMADWVKPDRYLIQAYLQNTTPVQAWFPLNLPNPLLLLLLALAVAYDLLLNKKGSERELGSFGFYSRVLLLVIMVLLILVSLFADSAAPFVYQGF